MDDQKIKELIAFAKEHDLEEVLWEENGSRISFRRDTHSNPSKQPSLKNGANPIADLPRGSREIIVTSPMVGTFWRATTRDHPPLVVEGELVEPGDKLAVVEAMKIPSDVISFAAGHIKRILVDNGQSVEYGQPLFVLEPIETPQELDAEANDISLHV